jgi:hypothetical protein
MKVDKILLGCLRGPDGETMAQLDRLNERGWNELLEATARHGLQPLFYERLTSGRGSMAKTPESILQALREAFLVSGASNELLYQDLRQVLRKLRERDIPVIVLKGAHLAELVYEQPALRPMGDIDILVRQPDLSKTAASLCQMGYCWKTEALACRQEALEAWLKEEPLAEHLTPFLTRPPHPPIEVHWTIDRAHAAPLQGLWSRARRATIAGEETMVLSPEDLLLHLCLHASRHQFEFGLRLLYDIRTALDRYGREIQWDRVRSRIRDWGVERSAYMALRLARELTNASVPHALLEEIEPQALAPRWLAMANQAALAGTEQLSAAPAEELLTVTAAASACASATFATKAASLWGLAFPSRQHMAEYMARRHRLQLTPLRRYTCYLTRAMDWLVRAIRSGWHWTSHRGAVARRFRAEYQRARLRVWLDRNDP